MSDNWQPGDLALCLEVFDNAVPTWSEGSAPIAGLIYTVESVTVGYDCFGREGIALNFGEIRRCGTDGRTWSGFNSEMFRKVHPRAADAEDRETIRLLTGQREKVT